MPIRFPKLSNDRPTRLDLIRHGEVVTFDQKSFNGQTDVALTPQGHAQLVAVAQQLVGKPIRAVYSSDLTRSVRGGEAIANALRVPLKSVPELREKHFGAWEGMRVEEVARLFPAEWAIWRADPSQSRPEGGESYEDVEKRVLPALESLLERHAEEEIVIVAHGGVNRVILANALDMPRSALFRIEQRYGAVNVIDYFRDRILVKQVNG